MKQHATTYTAPGQGIASLFNGKLSNAFVWRCIIGTPALSMAIVLEGFQLSSVWAAACLCLALATLIPAFTEFALNTEEE